jgi:hypothetical protein
MSEERQQHPQEPAEGGAEGVEAPGADRSSSGEGTTEGAGERTSTHPQEPSEGREEDVEAPGAEQAKDRG